MAKDIKTTIATKRKELEDIIKSQIPMLEAAEKISEALWSAGEEPRELDSLIKAARAFTAATTSS